jgi:hypothetical protein
MTDTAPARARRRRRRAAVVAPLAATALALGLSPGTADAASRSRTDSFTFTNRAGARVTCTVESFQEQFSEQGFSGLSVATFLSGPADCTGFLSIFVEYRRPDGESQFAFVDAEGRSVSAFFEDAAAPVRSSHFVFVPACECSHGYELSQPK